MSPLAWGLQREQPWADGVGGGGGHVTWYMAHGTLCAPGRHIWDSHGKEESGAAHRRTCHAIMQRYQAAVGVAVRRETHQEVVYWEAYGGCGQGVRVGSHNQ